MAENCPTCGTCLIEHRPAKPTMSLQEWFNKQAREELRGPLLTIEQACKELGWTFEDKPECCGKPVELSGMLGAVYHGECGICGKWVHDVSVQHGNACVLFPLDTVDQSTPIRWVTSEREKQFAGSLSLAGRR